MSFLRPIVRFIRRVWVKRRDWGKYITKGRQIPKSYENRDINTPQTREMKSSVFSSLIPAKEENVLPPDSVSAGVKCCPYCGSKDIVKRGRRKKKYETAQLYFCHHCQRTFTGQRIKGKSFPLRIILEGLSIYNTGFSLEESCRRLKEQFGIEVKPSTLSDWVKEFEPLCRYSRLRPYALKLYSPHQVIQSVHLFHRQVYDFSVHRAKLALVLQEYKHAKFENLREFLEAVQSECPHQFFREGERGSELKVNFDLTEVILKGKQNFATRLAGLALQAVNSNKERHKVLERFLLCNDSVTVAVEVPVYMDKYDLEYMQEQLKFKIPFKLGYPSAGIENHSLDNSAAGLEKGIGSLGQSRLRKASKAGSTSASVVTGHIDILQVRNGSVHILDYKPNASAGKTKSAVSQLTLYALALSRLTGLRLYDFKCAWFDENNYFEFFPLHVVYKLRKRAGKDDPKQTKMFDYR